MMNVVKKTIPKDHYEEGRGQYRPELIIIHIGAGLQEQIYLEFLHTEKSSHYCVSSRGEIWQFVEEKDTAYGNGIIDRPLSKIVRSRLGQNPNWYSISIEHEGYGETGITEIQYQTTGELVADIAKRWMIPLDSDHVIPHRWIRASKSCPGNVDVSRIIDIAKKKSTPDVVIPAIATTQIENIQKQISLLSRLVELVRQYLSLKK